MIDLSARLSVNKSSVFLMRAGSRMKQGYTSIRKELLKTLIGVSLVAFFILGSVLSLIIFRQSFRDMKEDMDFYLESISKQMKGHFQAIEENVLYIRRSHSIDDFFDMREPKTQSRFEDTLDRGINVFSERNLVEGIYPIVRDYYIFNLKEDYISSHFYPIQSEDKDIMASRLKKVIREYEMEGNHFFYQHYGENLELYFKIYDQNLKVIGYGVAVIEKNSLRQVYKDLDEKYRDVKWYIMTKDHEYIMGKELSSFSIPNLEYKKGKIQFDEKGYYYSVDEYGFGLSGYILVGEEQIIRMSLEGFKIAWIFGVFFVLFILLLIFNISKRLTQPLQTMVEKLQQVSKGDFRARLDDYHIQEFQEISQSFNEMTNKTDHLIKEVYEAQLLAKEARIQYLQAQINPHFLFNVLSIIAIRLKIHQDEDLYKMVQALAGLMRGKLFRKNEIEIPIEEEIEITEFYLYLSTERFKNRIFYEIIWEEEDLKGCFIPKLCIEPIVENAIIHGLEPKLEQGFIRVHIYQEEQNLMIKVEDDGIGFDMDKVIGDKEKKSPRVGLMNIKRLIYNLYGEAYGMEIESKLGEGTVVVLRLPMSRQPIV